MDMVTSTIDLCPENKTVQENVLLNIIKEVCSHPKTTLSKKLIGKVNRIIADCDLTHHTSLHKICNSNESTSTVLGLMHQTATELTFEEQEELNEAVINKIQQKIPMLTSALEELKQNTGIEEKSQKSQIREFQESLDEKLNTLKEQEEEKVGLMMEWLSHRLQDVSSFSCQTSEMLTLKTRILELKSKILHLRILFNIFTETNQSIEAYSKIQKDIKDQLRETEQRIKNYKDIIASDDN